MQHYATHIQVFLVDEVPKLALKTLNSFSLGYLRWLSHKPIGGQVSMLDGWEICLCAVLSSHVYISFPLSLSMCVTLNELHLEGTLRLTWRHKHICIIFNIYQLNTTFMWSMFHIVEAVNKWRGWILVEIGKRCMHYGLHSMELVENIFFNVWSHNRCGNMLLTLYSNSLRKGLIWVL